MSSTMTLDRHNRRRWSLSISAALLASFLVLLTTVAVGQAAPQRHPANRARIAARAVPHALLAAAARGTRADHALVSAAKSLNACLRNHRTHPARCNSARAVVQRAGQRLVHAKAHLAHVARARPAHRASSAAERRAPNLSVNGTGLSWTRVGHVAFYLLMRRIPGRANQFSVIRGASTSPPPVPGVTVAYSVRSAVYGSAWSNWQRISYPSLVSPLPPRAPTVPQPQEEAGTSVGPVTTTPAPPAAEEAGTPSAPVTPPTPPAPPVETANPQTAPTISVSGEALNWNAIAGVSAYVLVIKVPGHAEAFSSVSGTSTTPVAVPGATVHYSVRTAVNGSEWAPEVSITYPPAPKTEPTPPHETPSSKGAVFQSGVDAGWDLPEEPNAAARIGAKVVRLELTTGASPQEIEKFIRGYAEKGIRVAPLAGFGGSMPSAAEARNLATWAKAYGPGGTFWAHRSDGNLAIQTIEFGNETSAGYQYGDEPGDASYTARAKTYAVRVKEAAEAISATGMHVGVLAVAEDPSGDWMNGMFSAVPNLGSYVGGWVSHLYGPHWRSKIEGIVNQTAAHGASSTIPIDVTEWGISGDDTTCVTEDYGWNPCMNYQETGETLRKNVGEIRQMVGSRLGMFIFYQLRDQRPAGVTQNPFFYFGVLQNNMQPKGGFTKAAEEVLAE